MQKNTSHHKVGCISGAGSRIRTRVELPPNGFQDRPVMTASVSQHICSVLIRSMIADSAWAPPRYVRLAVPGSIFAFARFCRPLRKLLCCCICHRQRSLAIPLRYPGTLIARLLYHKKWTVSNKTQSFFVSFRCLLKISELNLFSHNACTVTTPCAACGALRAEFWGGQAPPLRRQSRQDRQHLYIPKGTGFASQGRLRRGAARYDTQ